MVRETPPVVLMVAASTVNLRLIRLLTSGVATGLDYDVDQIEDLRIAVDELANAAIALAVPGAQLTVTLTADGKTLRVSGAVPAAASAAAATAGPLLDGLAAQIVSTVVDDHDIRVADGSVIFSMSQPLPGAGAVG